MSDFSLDDPSFYEDFLVEAQEHFELIEQNFLALEESPGNLDILNAIFRSVHTIKGASGFLGLAKVQSLSHIGENILDDLRKGRMTLTPEVMELLFETVDVLKVLVGDVGINLRKQGTPKDPDTSNLIHRLENIRDGGGTSKVAPPQTATKTPGTFQLPARLERGWKPPGPADRTAASPVGHAVQPHVDDLHDGSGRKAAPFHQPHEA
jgi:two-component system chemotaxis sensor kinase CheA